MRLYERETASRGENYSFPKAIIIPITPPPYGRNPMYAPVLKVFFRLLKAPLIGGGGLSRPYRLCFRLPPPLKEILCTPLYWRPILGY